MLRKLVYSVTLECQEMLFPSSLSVVFLKAILAGDYILSIVSSVLARIGNTEVVSIMSQVVEDLVRGKYTIYKYIGGERFISFTGWYHWFFSIAC